MRKYIYPVGVLVGLVVVLLWFFGYFWGGHGQRRSADELEISKYWGRVFGREVVIDVNRKDSMGQTPLMLAAGEWGNRDFVRLLCAVGADRNARDNRGRTALSYAAGDGHPEIVEFLLQAGVDMNAPDNEGTTPLMWACFNGHPKVIELLTKAKANGGIKNKQGLTAKDILQKQVSRYEACMKAFP